MTVKQIAFLFPGQGSQALGMLDGFADNAAVQRVMSEASQALDQDLLHLAREGPVEDLNLTVNTQPIMLASGLAFFEAYRAAGGPMPLAMAGHSLGEYTALAAAGVVALAEAVRAVRFRAEQMQAAVPVGTGGMAAILGLPSTQVQACCESLSRPEQVVEAVNFNAPDQTVIAGHLAAVEGACAELKTRGAKRALMLPVSAPFHSSLLEPAARALADFLAGLHLHSPQTTVIHNVDVQSHESPDEIRQALAQQAMRPVRWVETLQALEARGVTHLVECGPGKVLTGLAKRVVPNLTVLSISDEESLANTLECLREAA